jgi:hypothetical protein
MNAWCGPALAGHDPVKRRRHWLVYGWGPRFGPDCLCRPGEIVMECPVCVAKTIDEALLIIGHEAEQL